jgi:uncharacterized protein (UPF0276 family)
VNNASLAEERHTPGPAIYAGLATTYEGSDPRLLERICPLVDYLEISPDSISEMTSDGPRLNAAILRELETVAQEKSFLVHGVGLSIASASGYSQDYIRLLDELFSRLPIAWHSEHLAYTMVEDEQLGTMLPPPRTQEALDMLCERVRFLRSRYKVPFLLEKVVRFLPEYPGDYSEAEFLNTLCRQTGCGLLLDVYNLECDQKNFDFNIEQFLSELDLRNVVEMHLAGGVEYGGFQVDVHTHVTQESTLEIARDVLARAPQVRAVTFEYLKEAVPRLGHDAICSELERLRRTIKETQVHYEYAG